MCRLSCTPWRRGRTVRQYVEDVDVAFTAMGAGAGAGALRIEPERYYRGGGEDWGRRCSTRNFSAGRRWTFANGRAALGMSVGVLARQLDRSLDDLYEEFSPGDTWQLIGPSYAGDSRHHRTMGDLGAGEVGDFVWQILGIAKEDMLRAFPQASSVAVTKEFIAQEESRLTAWFANGAHARLVDVYEPWIAGVAAALGEPGKVTVGRLSELLACREGPHVDVLETFTSRYDDSAELYNRAVHETQLGLRPLKTEEGELPFFGVYQHQGHLVRSCAYLRGGELVIGDLSFPLGPGGRLPLDRMHEGGIVALPGKAIVMVLQVRAGEGGQPLAMPCGGSVYMPAAFRLERLLREQGLLLAPVQPIVRVRFSLLDRLSGIDTTIHLPEHLAGFFSKTEIPRASLGTTGAISSRRQKSGWRGSRMRAIISSGWTCATPELAREIAQLDASRRELAARDPKAPQLRQIWKTLKPLLRQQAEATVRQVATDSQAAQLGVLRQPRGDLAVVPGPGRAGLLPVRDPRGASL